ncbi:MarR family winged helix-turn-helix transcriptional regulator [Uliginosibacterium sp. H3]|uniref:MarR family winged helix-turn-helix transcriptional regulator n=1 Tax=Uliginosibacterium silvisoli TaxID=3114758 RepID=A0ABU6K9K1_9RHOO|nr:MarR family winged helix-turn-helix transcriptional regulator [Uliginosibacterium sp. H3]
MSPRKNNVNSVDSNPSTASAPSDEALFSAIELFHFAFRAFTAQPDEILAGLGLGRVHHRVLYFVGRSPGLRVSDLLATLAVSKQALHGPLRQLVEADLIVVQTDSSDGRVRRLSLSRKGSALEQKLSSTQSEILAQTFGATGSEAEAGWRQVMSEIAARIRHADEKPEE